MSPQIRALFCVLFACVLPFGTAHPQTADGQKYYILQKGDTLYSIARRYKVSYEALRAANSISDPTKLKTGQKILIPTIYIVAKGDTLYSIARVNGTTVTELCRINGIKESSLLKTGMNLILPSSAAGGQVSVAEAGKTGKTQSASGGAVAASSPHNQSNAGGQVSSSSTSASPISVPEPMKTSDRKVDRSLTWPCQGEAHYLDGKLFGVMIRTGAGESVRSVIAGKVVSAGPYRGFGQVVFVQSKSGYIYVYGGNESLSVKVGDAVSAGDELAHVAPALKDGQPVEYFFVFHRGAAIDPAKAPRS